jgi:hypothetical protein
VAVLSTAFIHRALGHTDHALSQFECAFEERSGLLPFLAVEPALGRLQGKSAVPGVT